MDWNEETIGRLRALWDEGHSTAEIGRRLGVTKNAVVGKAHRLHLPARLSPIRRNEGQAWSPKRVAPPRTVGPTLPVFQAALPAPRLPEQRVPEQHMPEQRMPEQPRQHAPLRAVAAVPRTGGRTTTCCWPVGDPGTPSFHFCSDGAMTGKPYCAQHAAIAYVKVRDRREDAA